MELLRERLIECGWKDEMKALCRAFIKKKGRNNVTVDDLVHVITPKGREYEGKLAHPQTFPAKFEEVKEIIDKYKSNSSKIKKVQNLADFYATQTMQVKKENVKLRTKSYEEKYPTWDNRLNEYSLEQMHELLNNLEAKFKLPTRYTT
ncbi:hypothetical protein GBA52_011733 [Prunus armeniaca]|nr:hypothetical protein GBA52_011733 [Prunus armeniaca]